MNKIFAQDKIIIFDTEYTTWEGAQERKWSGPGEHREIVEIGAILADTENYQELDSFTIFVKPKKNPILSEYFIKLTGITQEKVDQEGIDFPLAIKKFSEWAENFHLYCFGSDLKVLQENCELSGIELPFSTEYFHNLRDTFSSYGIASENYMSSTIVEAFGEKPKREGHDALNDARTLLDGLRLLAKKIKG